MPSSTGGVRPDSFTILHVEDDRDHAELVHRCLREHFPEMRICHASDGQAALDFLAARRTEACLPDLILLDLRLPLLDGLTVLAEIKSSVGFSHVPAVVLTTSDAERDVKRAYAAHANSYLVKPMDLESFNKLIREIGTYWASWNRRV